MYIFPARSKATAKGRFSLVWVACTPSPEYPPLPSGFMNPFPATVVMMPVTASTLRMRWFAVSAI